MTDKPRICLWQQCIDDAFDAFPDAAMRIICFATGMVMGWIGLWVMQTISIVH